MKIRILLTLAFCLCLPAVSRAQTKEANKLIQFHMAILKKGPQWGVMKSGERDKKLEEHVANVVSLLDSGRMVMAGPFIDHGDIAGIFVFRATSAAEAKSWADADPAVKAGMMVAEMHPWWSEDIFGRAATAPLKMETVYFGFLKRGPNRKEGDSKNPEVQELQKAHIANINRLAETKKLVVAGPFGDDGDVRGIFVFRVASMKEAEELAATDPMIKIDRLRIELHQWEVPQGVIP